MGLQDAARQAGRKYQAWLRERERGERFGRRARERRMLPEQQNDDYLEAIRTLSDLYPHTPDLTIQCGICGNVFLTHHLATWGLRRRGDDPEMYVICPKCYAEGFPEQEPETKYDADTYNYGLGGKILLVIAIIVVLLMVFAI